MSDVEQRGVELDLSYRGYMTNRLFTTQLGRVPGDDFEERLKEVGLSDFEPIGGELEWLGMSIDEVGHEVLDIGIGGGRSLEQGLVAGFDMYGIEIGLKARRGLSGSGLMRLRQQEVRRYLEKVMRANPGRVWEVDATKRIPQRDNTFDTVLACLSLPDYARDERELVTAILEMIRLSRERVAFTAGYSDEPSLEDMGRYGVGNSKFQFPMAQFLKDLEYFGLEHEWRVVHDPSERAEGDIVSAHLFTNAKNQTDLDVYRDYIFEEYVPRRW